MLGFIGSYEHTMDAKNRLFVPAKFRDGLTGKFIIKSFTSEYPCIQCFRIDDFEKAAAEAADKVDNPYRRRVKLAKAYLGAAEVTVDGQGRIAIPAQLIKDARLDKEAVIVGMGDYVEIWNPTVLRDFTAVVDQLSLKEEDAVMHEESIAIERIANGDFLQAPGGGSDGV